MSDLSLMCASSVHVSTGVGKGFVCLTSPHALVRLLADSASVQTVVMLILMLYACLCECAHVYSLYGQASLCKIGAFRGVMSLIGVCQLCNAKWQ